MATRLLCRTAAFRRTTLPALGFGLTSSLLAIHNQRPLRMDAISPAEQNKSFSSTTKPERKDRLDSEVLRQLSGGSLSGFVAGLLISVFSKTLVLLAGIGMLGLQVASRSGLDLVKYLRLRERFQGSRILAVLNQHTAFKISFAIAFAMSAFMSF
ncbi:hypothetical protein QBC40DRAFT_179360 [Triangularia verruculosa]|uniref:Fun14 family protein n=1 Tax=Triangularia verruculosa TaxID=2587418 RepID=A0AAN6XCK2_9PEZI|nr:hypothetical protein QBC40DRAFT_179360 [Triangularia verruculosa]